VRDVKLESDQHDVAKTDIVIIIGYYSGEEK